MAVIRGPKFRSYIMRDQPSKSNQPTITEKLLQASQQLPYYLRAIRLIWGATPRLTLAWASLLLLQGLLPVATVYLTKLLVDSLVNAIGVSFAWANLRPLAFLGAAMTTILLAGELFQGLLEWVRTAQSEYIQDYIKALIHEKSAAVDLAFYESPEYFDHLHRAQSEAGSRSLALLESTGSLLQNTVTLLAMAGVLIPYGAWLPAILIVGTLPALLIVFRYNYVYNQWWKQTTTDRRWVQYFDMLLTFGHVAAEIRLFDLGPHFRSAYREIRRRLRSERLQLIRHQSLARLGAGAFALLVSGVAILWVVWRALQGLFSLGDLALFYQAFNRGQSLVRSVFGNLGQIYANSLFLSNLFEFLGLQSQVVDPADPVPIPAVLARGVQFQGVTFRYSGSDRAVLQDFNLNFPAGTITAIVGPNGAGKSTLVKLLCRFYDPEAGSLIMDGVDVRRFSVAQLRRMITVLFQLPVPYYLTAAQNIALGDLSDGRDPSKVEAAARGAGAHHAITRLPRGYDTLLGKYFTGGVELSIGEWQRVALARAFFRQGQIIILDEPTSAMDSWAESDWMARFRQLVDGRTAIVITHRFTTARQADIIHVMDQGKIIESGTHEELIARDGMYAQSWRAQTGSIPISSEAHYQPQFPIRRD